MTETQKPQLVIENGPWAASVRFVIRETVNWSKGTSRKSTCEIRIAPAGWISVPSISPDHPADVLIFADALRLAAKYMVEMELQHG